MSGSELFGMAREAVEALPVRLSLLFLAALLFWGFVHFTAAIGGVVERVDRLESTSRFLVCSTIAPMRGWNPAACQTHIRDDISEYFPPAGPEVP